MLLPKIPPPKKKIPKIPLRRCKECDEAGNNEMNSVKGEWNE